ncbi:TolB family protein [Dyadobacter jiangsuensis]|uniref:WD40 repeat protein n=1 Tax=Dyadobacter jiangsuensis TaxID=1591085 RepID=A0A2P8FLB9_9BACT|nr:PD40 domain-containing protein [Dyadobacter jiangsuensis]PSL22508.1 WD40 repeat protein [Dyadobacter jiangsuensis]
MKQSLLIAAVTFLFYSCSTDPNEEYNNKPGEFLSEVLPLTEFNSEYDDYNMALPANTLGQSHLIFSSKREKKQFLNLVYFPVVISYKQHAVLEKSDGTNTVNMGYLGAFNPAKSLAAWANGNFNVYGPKVLSFEYDMASFGNAKDLVLFYADDSEGNMEIKYLINNNKGISGPFKFDILNSPKDDGYPSFSRFGDKIFFSSNRDGDFDIYELSIPRVTGEINTVESLISPKKFQLRKVEELSSDSDDKCPYFQDNMMVFVSDRPGGKGGHDIYYARLVNGKWSEPVNAGDRINTPHNEYRPIIPDLLNFTYPIVFFSSDRPGGKGGYDLYMTGLTEKR